MKIEKFEKLVTNLYDKTDYVIHIRDIKQALNHSLVLKKVWGVITFNQNAWLKPCIDMNADLKKKKDFEEGFYNLMNNCVFGKTMDNVWKHRNSKLVITGRKRKIFTEHL